MRYANKNIEEITVLPTSISLSFEVITEVKDYALGILFNLNYGSYKII